MKGSVVQTWFSTLEEIYGEEPVLWAMDQVGWDKNRVITPLDDIDETIIRDFMGALSKKLNIPEGAIWREVGKKNIETFSKWFPSYFERASLKGFLMMMDEVHYQLTRMIKGAKPPRLIATELGSDVITIEYRSHRGMYDYFLGLLEGSSNFFGEKLEILEREEDKEGDIYILKVKLKFEKGTVRSKRFSINRILSLGLIRWLPFKIGLLVGVLSLPVLAFGGVSGSYLAVLSTAIGIIAVFASWLLLLPQKTLMQDVAKIRQKDFTEVRTLKTADMTESISRTLADGIEDMKKDILFLKGGIDDMYSYTERFSVIADYMAKVSDNISDVVQEVASGAIHQAEETEKSVYVLSENVEYLKSLVEQENESKKELEEAVEEIRHSYNSIQDVVATIQAIREDFAKVNEQAAALVRRANDMAAIVETVKNIAWQTNMLALNASIEASRAGETGKGFAVVAERIRTLAENSSQSTEDIRKNLELVSSEIKSLDNQISARFEELDRGSEILKKAADQNLQSTARISSVSDNIIELVVQLSAQAEKIASVFENIHSLAAIAEQNSASAEEMSASVTEYSSKIKDLMAGIQELKELANLFKESLGKYRI